MTWRAASSIALLACMSAWGFWLLHHTKTKADYVVTSVERHPPLTSCEWVQIDSPSISSMGFSQDEGHAWSDRATAFIAFPVKANPDGAWLDLAVSGVAGGNIFVELEGGRARYAVKGGGILRVPVPEASRARVVLVTVTSKNMRPPEGPERRWLGVAISGLRICEGL